MRFQQKVVHKMVSALGLAAIALSLACGGHGKDAKAEAAPEPPPVVHVIPEGFWNGRLHPASGHSIKASALVLADGEAILYDRVGRGFISHFKLDQGHGKGDCLAVYPESRHPDGSREVPMQVRLDGAKEQERLSGTYQIGQERGTASFQSDRAKYEHGMAISDLLGTYNGDAYVNGKELKHLLIQLNAGGVLTGQAEEGVHLVGTYTIPDAAKAGFHLACTLSVPGDPSVSLTGLGLFEHDAKTQAKSLHVFATGGGKGFLGDLKKP